MGCGASSLKNSPPKQSVVSVNPLVTDEASPLQKNRAYEAIKKNDSFLVEKILQEVEPVENLGLPGENYTCLHAAASHNSFQAMEMLITWLTVHRKDDIENILRIVDSEGFNPVETCIKSDSSETFYVLLSANIVNSQEKNKKGESLADLCRQYSYTCLELLEKPGVSKNDAQPSQQNENINKEKPTDKHISPEQENYQQKAELIAQKVHQVKETKQQETLQKDVTINTDPAFKGIPTTSKVYQLMTQFAKNNGSFKDPDFKPNLTSITYDLNNSENNTHFKHFKNAVWKRPNELFKCDFSEIALFDTIDPHDINQGLLGVCYLLSSLSALAEFPSRFTPIYINQNSNKYGVYGMRLYVKGVPTEIVIDDYIPCHENSQDPLFSKPKGKELWVLLAEKVWAKLYHNYINCEAGFMDEALEYLLGSPSFRYLIKEQETKDLFKILLEADRNKYVICAGTNSSVTEEMGLVADHAYSIISVHQVKNYQLVKLRNPWGSFEWKGDFGDNSKLWTPELKKEVGYTNADDGLFCMTVQDFKKCFEFYSINAYNEGWQYSYLEVESDPRHADYFTFTVNQPCEIYLRIHQSDLRLLSKEEQETAEYSSGDLILTKVENDGTYSVIMEDPEMVHNGVFFGARSIYPSKDNKLKITKPGTYILRTKLRWRHENRDKFTLSAYAPVKIELKKVQPIKDFLVQMLRNIGRKAQKQDIGKNCKMSNAFYLHYLYIYLENQSQQNWSVTIRFSNLQNMRLGKPFRESEDTLRIEIPAGGNEVALCKKVDVAGATSYEWEFEYGYN